MCDEYKKRGVQLCLCNPNINVMSRLDASGLVESIGEKYIFVSTQDAVQACLIQLETDDEEAQATVGIDVEAIELNKDD